MVSSPKSKNKILIFGATGYLGKYMVKASVSAGHPTFVYARPAVESDHSNPSKLQLHRQFESMGVTIFQGELDEHEKLVSALQQVDVVISTLAVPQHLDQLKIIKAMEEAGTIKRFVPSEFGNEVDRVSGLPPFEALLENKRKIRRATEAAGICYTYVSANAFSAYFIDYLLHPHIQRDEVIIYGTGHAKGRMMKRSYMPEDEIIKLYETLPFPENIAVAILHNIFIKGDQMSFELTEDDLEASKLYPDHVYTSVDKLLDICLSAPPKPKLAAFA
ncbi:hypothetical protein TIFTF001_009961 [Ficus carica]|uniref:NmrA-like domain-containing protein n=1 Tax=Ficus carica TaxID=3494 RepID=A0AA88CZE5_FICCA|nr:hypothetical protein TIFTF001_009961 [Ficus carica]